jgi:hypothetical protein
MLNSARGKKLECAEVLVNDNNDDNDVNNGR